MKSTLYMNNRIPESFFIYQELITKLAYQKAQLKQEYQLKINSLTNEMSGLINKIKAQNKQLEDSYEYIKELEEKLSTIKKAS